MNQRVVLAGASLLLVCTMGAAALRVRYAMADRAYLLAERIHGRDQVRYLEKTLDLAPGKVPARLQLARDLMTLGQYERALTQYGQLTHVPSGQEGVNTADLFQQQGEALYQLKRYSGAEAALRHSLECNGTPAVAGRAHLFLARTLQAENRPADARAQLEAAIAQQPEDEDAYLDLGSLLFSERRTAEANSLGNKMTAAGPKLAMDWRRLQAGNALSLGSPADALSFLRQAATADPSSPRPGIEAASILIRSGHTRDAVAVCAEAAARAPQDMMAQLTLASTLEADQQWNRAVTIYKAVEAVHPSAIARWVAQGRGPLAENPALYSTQDSWQQQMENLINPGDVRLMGPDSEPGIQQAWYAGDSGDHNVRPAVGNALFVQGVLAQARKDYTGSGQFYENALHFIPNAESARNTPFTNELREAIEEGIDSILLAQISGLPTRSS